MSPLTLLPFFLLVLLSFSHNSFSDESCPSGSSGSYGWTFHPDNIQNYPTSCTSTRCGETISYPISYLLRYDSSGYLESTIRSVCPDQCYQDCDDEPDTDNNCVYPYIANSTGSCRDPDNCSMGTSLSGITSQCEPDDCETGSFAGSSGICSACPPETDCYVPPAPTCTIDEDLINNVCVPRPPVCTGTDILVDGYCVSPDSPTVCSPGQIVRNGICVTPEPGGGGGDDTGGGSVPDPTPDPEPLPIDPDPLPDPVDNPTPNLGDGYDRSAGGSVLDCSSIPTCELTSTACRSYIVQWNNHCEADGSNIPALKGGFDPDTWKTSITDEIDLSEKINELSEGENWFTEACPAGYTLAFSFITMDVEFDAWCSFAKKIKPIFLSLIFFLVGRRIVIAASGGS